MSAKSTEETNTGVQCVPALKAQDADANQNIMVESSKAEVKSGIITEGDSKGRQKSGRSSGECMTLSSFRAVFN